MTNLKTTNTLLFFIAVPVIFYILHILSFIFIPLIMSMFIALLFLPLMRWLGKKKVPKAISIVIVVLIMAGGLKIGGELIKLSSQEIMATQDQFVEKAETKIINLIIQIEDFFGIVSVQGENVLVSYIQKNIKLGDLSAIFNKVGNTLSMTLTTLFFVILWLAESINFQKVLNSTIFRQKHSSVKTFMKIEKDLITFIKVKFIVSLLTGIGIGIACVIFDVSFPIFWGIFAFAINFVQMIGSFIAVIFLALFAFVELSTGTPLLLFVLSITGVEVLCGSILEPVFMGKSFSINVITILIMLMLWGFVWGIPGMILSIPITVFLKILFEQFEGTKVIATLLSGNPKE